MHWKGKGTHLPVGIGSQHSSNVVIPQLFLDIMSHVVRGFVIFLKPDDTKPSEAVQRESRYGIVKRIAFEAS